MDNQTSSTPGDWVKDIAFAVRDLIRQYGIERFRDMVQQWAIDRDAMPADSPAHDLPLMRSVDYYAGSEPVPKTLPEKYVCLAVIHDGICLEAEPVNPWPQKPSVATIEKWDAKTKAAWSHWGGLRSMVSEVEDGKLSWERCPWEDDLRRELLAVLEDVRVDLATWATARPPAKQKAAHNADFTMVNWYGTEYTFALGVQSLAVEALWNEWEKTGLGLHQETIRNAVDAERDSFRMDTAFRGHPAFGTMICRSGDGRYRLCPLDNQEAPPEAKASARITSKARRKRV